MGAAASPHAGPRVVISMENQMAANRMRGDEDIVGEADALMKKKRSGAEPLSEAIKVAMPRPYDEVGKPRKHVPLNWRPGAGGHRPNADTRRLLREAGGLPALQRFTTLFYQRSFADKHIDLFIRDRSDPHGERFASWIAEKFGEGQPWTEERATRPVCPFHAHGHTFETPHDRSSAHFAAWHSPKREEHKFGQHFKLDDCRVWMRLHFWAARESGIADRAPEFFDYYVRFIGHFVSVYERSASTFARDSARWSEDPLRVLAYLEGGNKMDDVIGVPNLEALKGLPAEERRGDWPYER